MPLYDHIAVSVANPLTQVTKQATKTSPGTVFSLFVTNANATIRYFQWHNLVAVPAAAAVPVESYPIPGGAANTPGSLLLDITHYTDGGAKFTTGIAWGISTTYATFTDSATASDHIVVVRYV